jgi:hypothetical protein
MLIAATRAGHEFRIEFAYTTSGVRLSLYKRDGQRTLEMLCRVVDRAVTLTPASTPGGASILQRRSRILKRHLPGEWRVRVAAINVNKAVRGS